MVALDALLGSQHEVVAAGFADGLVLLSEVASGKVVPGSGAIPALLRCAGGSASSAASLRAISVCRFMMASQGDWIGSLVFGALTGRPTACTCAVASSA